MRRLSDITKTGKGESDAADGDDHDGVSGSSSDCGGHDNGREKTGGGAEQRIPGEDIAEPEGRGREYLSDHARVAA